MLGQYASGGYMKVIMLLLTIIGMLIAGCSGISRQNNGDFHLYSVDNKDGKISPQSIEEALKSNGFTIGENANIQAELLHIFKDNNFKVYNNISFYHKEITLELLKKQAESGVLVPMGMVVYQLLNEDDLHIVLPTAGMQAKIIGKHSQELKSLEAKVLKVITTLFATAKHSYNDTSKSVRKELLTKYIMDLKGSDFEDAREELEESFEEKFAKAGFAMPGYFDLTDELGEGSPYDFYVTYAICKLDVLRTIVKIEPEAAVLGPCTTMIYKKKNEDKIVMGFASMYNWISSANIEDKASVNALLELQSVYENILKDVTQN